jgi:hypothetical protein
LWTVTIRSCPVQPPSAPASPEDVVLPSPPPSVAPPLEDALPELLEAAPELLPLDDPPPPSLPESGPDGLPLLLLLQALMTHASASEPMLVIRRNRG